MMMTPTLTKVTLTEDEIRGLRGLPGGTAYVGIVEFATGRRGGRYRPSRTTVWRTQEAAEKALASLRFVQAERYRGVHLVDATGAIA